MSNYKPHPNPGEPYLTQSLIVAWYGDGSQVNKPKKVSHYDLIIRKVIPNFEIYCYNGNEIPLPKSETVIRTRITKGNAKKLMDQGMKLEAAYFTYTNPRSRKKNLDISEK